jgi:hypothetical protein
MASFNLSSTVISNRDATPKVFTDAYVQGGEVLESEGFVQSSTATDGSGTLFRLCTVPSNARVSSLEIQTDSFGTSAAIDIGVYWPTFIPVGAGLSASNQSAVINTQLFCSALAVSNATASTNVINSSGNNSIKNQELPLWSACGLASDPMIDLDIVANVQTAIALKGYIGLKARYVKQ